MTPSLLKNTSTTRSGSTSSKRTYCQLPPLYLRINLKDKLFFISIDFLEFYLSRNFIECSLEAVYQHGSWKFSNLMVFRLLENEFACQKIELRHFYLCPPGKILPKSISSSSRQREITHRLIQHSFENLFIPSRKETRNTEISLQKKLSEKLRWEEI